MYAHCIRHGATDVRPIREVQISARQAGMYCLVHSRLIILAVTMIKREWHILQRNSIKHPLSRHPYLA